MSGEWFDVMLFLGVYASILCLAYGVYRAVDHITDPRFMKKHYPKGGRDNLK